MAKGNYYEQKVPPTRDERLEVGETFHGFGCDLLNCSRNCCLKNKNRSFWQASSACQMSLAIIMSSSVENSVIIMHGPVGCGHNLHLLTANTNNGKALRGLPVKPVNWMSTNLTSAEIITGGEQKLREAIEYADRKFRPENIFVISTCAPNIIGDDVEQVVEEEEKVVSAQVAAIHCPGFRSRMVSSAYDAFYHALLRHMKFEPVEYKDYVPVNEFDVNSVISKANYEYQKAHCVNLMSLESAGAPDEQELTRLLNALDLNVNVVAEYSNADKIRFISEAALNISLCWMHDDYILGYLEEKYGIPYYQGMPLGFRATKQWLADIGERFGIRERAEQLADYEEKLVRKAIEPFLPTLKGKRVLITGGSVRSAVEAELLEDLGMDVIGVVGMLYDENADPVFEKFGKEMPKVPVTLSDQPFEYLNQVVHYKPDIVLAHAGWVHVTAKAGIPTVQEFDTGSSFFGYSGVFQIAKKLDFALRNTAYVKNIGKHMRLPYKKSWFKQDPFTYMRDD